MDVVCWGGGLDVLKVDFGVQVLAMGRFGSLIQRLRLFLGLHGRSKEGYS